MPTAELKQLRETMLRNYLDIIQISQKRYAAVLEPLCRQYDLTRNELDVILFLYNNPQFDRAADIVSIRHIAKSHVSLSVGNLEKRQLLTREFSDADRRSAHLKLTDMALPIAQHGVQLQQSFFRQVFSGLSPDELRLWGSIITKICSNIQSMNEETIETN